MFHRSTLDQARDVALSPGDGPGSEAEVKALIALIHELRPEAVVAMHAPLACIDDLNGSPFGQWISDETGLPLVEDVGYPTPGSFGTWGAENGFPVVTYELPLTDNDTVVLDHVPLLARLLAGVTPWS